MSSARTDLCGGRLAMIVPTATPSDGLPCFGWILMNRKKPKLLAYEYGDQDNDWDWNAQHV